MRSFKHVVAFLFLLQGTALIGQSIKSPYSVIGIGDLNFNGLVQNQGMGELGIGYTSRRSINLQNPAWLYRNALSTFQVAIEGEYRSFATSEATEGGTSAGLRYISFAMPLVNNRLSTSFGVLPFSTVNYNLVSRDIEPESNVEYQVDYNGNGGLTQVYWSNGLRVTKSLGVGLKIRYVFGSIDNENIVSINDENLTALYTSAFVENHTFSDFNFTGGISYRKDILKNHVINAGATYDFSAILSGNRDELMQRRNINNQVLRTDTLVLDEPVNFNLPNTFAFGLSFEQINKYTFGVDIRMQDWQESGGFEGQNTTYQKTIKFSAGGEFIPQFDDVNKYFNRVVYRAGFSYEQLPYLVKDVKLNDFGINFGGSFPVGGISSLDFALKIGQRGTLDNDLVRERYFRFVFGATVNDRWFIRRRYD